MACQTCKDGPNFTTNKRICRVCELLDGNTGEQYVAYCDFCKAHICKSCWTNLARRAMAFGIETENKISNAVESALKQFRP